MRERGDRMSGADATTLPMRRGKLSLETKDELNKVLWSGLVSSDLLHCLRSTSRRVAIMEPSRREGTDVGVVS